jgi:transcriptional regulator with XRE-family HTH domain
MASSKLLTREKLISRMRKRQGRRTQKAFAVELGISEPYLSDIYAGKRDPGVKVLSKLGLASLTAYKEQPASSNMPRKLAAVGQRYDGGQAEMLATARNAESVEMDWLVQHAQELGRHKGEWLLIHRQHLLVHSRDFAAVRAAVRERQIYSPFVYYVPTDEESASVTI